MGVDWEKRVERDGDNTNNFLAISLFTSLCIVPMFPCLYLPGLDLSCSVSYRNGNFSFSMICSFIQT